MIDAVIAEAESASNQQTAGLNQVVAGITGKYHYENHKQILDNIIYFNIINHTNFCNTANENICKETVNGCGATGKVGIEQFKSGANR